MFLIERMIGVGIYGILLIFFCLIMAFTNLRPKTVFGIYTITLAVIAFFYEPYITADLHRIFDMMNVFSMADFADFFKTYVISSSVPAARILFWIVGKTGISHLISVVATVGSYSCIFYPLYKTAQRFSVSRRHVAIAMLLLMSGSIYMSVIGGIRMMLAMSLIVFCFYRENIERRFHVLHILLYIIALFMHNMAVIILVIRFAAMLFDRRQKVIGRIFLILFMALAGLLLVFRFEVLVSDVVDKALEFIRDESGYVDYWEYLMGVLFLLVFAVIIKNYRALHCNEKYEVLHVFNIGAMLSAIVAILFCFEFSIYYRFAGHLLPILMMPMLLVTLHESRYGEYRVKRRMSFETIIVIVSALLLLISCSRGSMSALKFFVLNG